MKTKLALIALFIALIVSALPTFNVKADDNNVRSTNNVKAADLLPTVKLHRANHSADVQCTTDGAPELSYYMDGDTDTETAYSDYLSDLGWWTNEVSNPCTITPEILN